MCATIAPLETPLESTCSTQGSSGLNNRKKNHKREQQTYFYLRDFSSLEVSYNKNHTY